MRTNASILRNLLRRKLAVIALIAGSTVAAFATLGDGKIKGEKPGNSMFFNKSNTNSFSLRSNYAFRGATIVNNQKENARYINMNTTVTYQRGNTTYVVPMKKKVLISNVKLDLSNRSLRHN